MQTTTGVMTHKYIGYEGKMIRVGDLNFMVPEYRKVESCRGDTVTVRWSVDRDGVMIASSVKSLEAKDGD